LSIHSEKFYVGARCAEAVISFAVKAVEVEDIQSRLFALEEMAAKFKRK